MRTATILALALVVVVAGCGRKHSQEEAPLTLEERADTTGLSQGSPLLTRIEPYRTADGGLRVRGEIGLPDGARIQVSIYRGNSNDIVARQQVFVQERRFDSPPMLGPDGPLPPGPYRFEYLALFNEAWQTADVMKRAASGRNLRGPGVTRDRVGGAAFYLVEERTL